MPLTCGCIWGCRRRNGSSPCPWSDPGRCKSAVHSMHSTASHIEKPLVFFLKEFLSQSTPCSSPLHLCLMHTLAPERPCHVHSLVPSGHPLCLTPCLTLAPASSISIASSTRPATCSAGLSSSIRGSMPSPSDWFRSARARISSRKHSARQAGASCVRPAMLDLSSRCSAASRVTEVRRFTSQRPSAGRRERSGTG